MEDEDKLPSMHLEIKMKDFKDEVKLGNTR